LQSCKNWMSAAQILDVSYKEVDVRVAATKPLSEIKLIWNEWISESSALTFCPLMTAKIIERNQLKYPIARAVSCFVPSTTLNNRNLAGTRLRDLLQILFTMNHINAVTADSSKGQFSSDKVIIVLSFRGFPHLRRNWIHSTTLHWRQCRFH